MKAIDERRLSKVTSIETPYGPAVEKTFVSAESCLWEADVYRRMEGSGLRCAKLLEQKEKSLILSRLFGEDYVSLLARQEREGLDLHPWHSLLAWAISFYEITGLIQNDMNLRNFLFCDSEAVGIDFEDCREGDAGGMLAELSAFVLLYDPPMTENKTCIAGLIRDRAMEQRYCTEESFGKMQEEKLRQLLERRRLKKISRAV